MEKLERTRDTVTVTVRITAGNTKDGGGQGKTSQISAVLDASVGKTKQRPS